MIRRFFLSFACIFAGLFLGGCAHLAAQWPAPAIAYTHAATPEQANRRLGEWVSQPGRAWGHAGGTGSMLPYIRGGLRECLLYDRYTGQPIRPGMVVVYGRTERVVQYDSMGILTGAYYRAEWGGGHVMHLVVAVSADGRYMLVTGTNTKTSDGWQAVAATSLILREIVTVPAGLPAFRWDPVRPARRL